MVLTICLIHIFYNFVIITFRIRRIINPDCVYIDIVILVIILIISIIIHRNDFHVILTVFFHLLFQDRNLIQDIIRVLIRRPYQLSSLICCTLISIVGIYRVVQDPLAFIIGTFIYADRHGSCISGRQTDQVKSCSLERESRHRRGSAVLVGIYRADTYIMGTSVAVGIALRIVRIVSVNVIDHFFDLSFTRAVRILNVRALNISTSYS